MCILTPEEQAARERAGDVKSCAADFVTVVYLLYWYESTILTLRAPERAALSSLAQPILLILDGLNEEECGHIRQIVAACCGNARAVMSFDDSPLVCCRYKSTNHGQIEAFCTSNARAVMSFDDSALVCCRMRLLQKGFVCCRKAFCTSKARVVMSFDDSALVCCRMRVVRFLSFDVI